jgi:hypothetical protein
MKYSALKPEYNLKTRYEEISDMQSYMYKLTDKEKEWLNKFSEEYVCGSFPDKKKNPKEYRKRLHKKKVQELECYQKNNHRNNDVLSKANACGKINRFEDVIKEVEEQKDEGDEYLEQYSIEKLFKDD